MRGSGRGAERRWARATTGATPALLRRINAGLVLDTLRGSGPLRVIEMAGRTALSRPTVDAAIDDLVRLGLVEVVDASTDNPTDGQTVRGRPARRFAFRPSAGHVVGIDVGVEQVTVVVADLRGDPVAARSVAWAYDLGRAARLRAILDTTDTVLAAAGLDPSAVRAAGIGSPGIVDAATGTVRLCRALPAWSEVDLGTTIGDRLGCPVAVDNDANLAAVGEWWRGAAQGCRDVILFFYGRHFGAGILVEDRVVRGHDGGAGELDFQGLWSSTADDVTRTAYVIATMALLLSPELIVVAGRHGEDPPVSALRAALRRLTADILEHPPRIAPSVLGAHATALGGIRSALWLVEDHLLDTLEFPGR